ncbi:MAG: hypothetical protein IJZ55_05430 [Lachnospiraceae bacterium]|nr:hypothetical protein [Lachnospiraceae bacterium]
MKRILLGLFSLVFLTLTACGTQELPRNTGTYGATDGLELFLSEHQPVKEPWTEEDFETLHSYMQPETFEQTFTVAQIQELMEEKETVERLTAEQAAEDVHLTFDLLAYGYGGYHYFGGNEVFLPIRDTILDRLSHMETIETTELRNLLWDNLSPVLIDSHFNIHTSLSVPYDTEKKFLQQTYYVPDFYFDDPTGIDSQYVKHTIGPEGAITYCLATVCTSPEALPNSLIIEGKEHTLKWVVAESVSRTSEEAEQIYSETTVAAKQLPVIRSYALRGDQTKLEAFTATGTAYRKAPQLVLDLRGNRGGQDIYSDVWLNNFSDINVKAKNLFVHKRSNLYYATYEFDDTFSGDWEFGTKSDGIPWKRDNLVFVLIDNNTASSGETFARLLSFGHRVILVGCNTMGCSTFANNIDYYLPNSGINLYFGHSLCFFDCIENREGVGLFPDLWVNPADSLDAVVRLCKYYGLIENKSNFKDLFIK